MKKIIIMFFILISYSAYGNDCLFRNIAKIILQENKDEFLAVVEYNKEIKREISLKYMGYNITGLDENGKGKQHKKEQNPIYDLFMNCHILSLKNYFCKKIDNNIIVKKNNINYTSQFSYSYDYINIKEGEVWLLILKSMYKEDKKSFIDDFSHRIYPEFEEEARKSEYLSPNSFFYIKYPESKNSICLYASIIHKDNMPLYKEDLVADVQLLSKLFSNNDNFLRDEKLELVAKAMPNLKTESGKKIAEAMISIIEKEPVLLESILGRKTKITVDVNYESVY